MPIELPADSGLDLTAVAPSGPLERGTDFVDTPRQRRLRFWRRDDLNPYTAETVTLYPTVTGEAPPASATQDMRITFALENANEFGADFISSTVGGGPNQTLAITCVTNPDEFDNLITTAQYVVMGFGNFPHITEIISATLWLTATALITDGPVQASFMIEPFPVVDPQANDDWFTSPGPYVWSDDAECLAASDWFPELNTPTPINMLRAFRGEVDPGLLELPEYHAKPWPARINLVIGNDGFSDLGLTLATADHANPDYHPRLVLVYR